jgi:nicotinate phosphoribosyltransferase
VFDGRPVLKLSSGKATLPGAKQVWRLREHGRFVRDLVALADEQGLDRGEALLRPVMMRGERTWHEPVATSRQRAAIQRHALPRDVRTVDARPYPVVVSEPLQALADDLARHLTTTAKRPGM